MQRYSDTILNQHNRPVSNARIVVDPYVAGAPANLTGTSTAAIYTPDGGPAVQFVTSDAKGRFAFEAADGHYLLTVTGSGLTEPQVIDITLNDPIGEALSIDVLGTKGDGVVDDLAKINAAILMLNAAGGGELRFGPKTYGVSGEVVLRSNVRLVGVRGVTRIKLIAPKDSQVISHPYRGGTEYLDNVAIIGIACDGNYTIQPGAVSNSVATFDPCRNLLLEDAEFCNGNGYGVGLQSGPGLSDTRQSENVTLRRVKIHHNGNMGGYDGLDVKSVIGMTLDRVDSYNNIGDGIDIRGRDVVLLNCSAYENGESGFEISASTNGSSLNSAVTMTGCTGHTNKNGLRLASGATGTGYAHIAVNGGRFHSNVEDGIAAINSGGKVSASIHGVRNYGNGQHGIACYSAHELVAVSGSYIYSNTGSGLYCNADGVMRVTNTRSTANIRYGYEEGASGQRNTLGSGCDFRSNTLGSVLMGSLARIHIAADFVDYALGSTGGDIIASAAAVTIPYGGSVFHITGTTTINTIAGGYRDRVITLNLPAGVTIAHTSGTNAIRLPGGTNIVTTAARNVLQLVFDGANWRQVAYSANT